MASGLAATVYPIVPLPEPVPVPLIVTHGALVVALHAQPTWVVSVTVPGPPDAPIGCVVGLTA